MENNLLIRFLTSSIGKKVVMSLTGLFLCVFLVEHLYTNLLLFAGDGGIRFNEASASMVTNLLIRIVEVVLFLAIITHTLQAFRLTRENSNARPKKYAVNRVNETSNWFSRNMLPTGGVVLFFLVVHLRTFFVPYRIQDTVGHEEGQLTLAQLVAGAFANPLYSGLYLVGLACLALHLNHGLHSGLQTLGLNNRRYAPLLKKAATGFALLIFFGYASMPVAFYLASTSGYDLLGHNLPAAAASATALAAH